MNMATHLRNYSKKNPSKTAVFFPAKNKYLHLTFNELDQKSDHLAFIFKERGIRKGSKVLLFLKPSLQFVITTFALLKIGSIPILIDPGMGVKNFINSLKNVKPSVLFSVFKGLIIRLIFKSAFKDVKSVLSSRKISSLINKKNHQNTPFPLAPMDKDKDIGAILFTSGGTGPPKGVVYTHQILNAQINILREIFSLKEEDVDLPGFPFFCIFTISMGMSVCLPNMDPRKPAKCDPKKLVKNILDHKVTFMGGSPAIWKRVANYCLLKKINLPTIKFLAMFGAPVSPQLIIDFEKILPNGDVYTPYGATESLPITNISGKELKLKGHMATRKGLGTLVGKSVSQMEIKIIKVSEQKIMNINKAQFLPPYEIGEIIVSGPVVTKAYYHKPEETLLAKIYDGSSVWHRMGDIGYLDEDNNLWFCGRKAHIVHKKLYPIPCEAIFNQHPKIYRTAIIPFQKETALVIERKDKKTKLSKEEQNQFESELLTLAQQTEHTKEIKKFFYHKSFPVDIRHNIKIDRKELKHWALQKG